MVHLACGPGGEGIGGLGAPPPGSDGWELTTVIHVEFDRAGRRFPAHHVFPLELRISVDLVVAEHVAAGQEGAIVVEAHQSLAQRAAYRRNVHQLLWRK